MTEKEIFQSISNSHKDVLQNFLDVLQLINSNYCVIGGLAVNAYVEPLISLDLDIIIAIGDIDAVCKLVKEFFKLEYFPHSINLNSSNSDLRIQIKTDERYQLFVDRSEEKMVLGYKMRVAKLEDVLQGKVWAYMDEQRRKSKRRKDLADIERIIEAYPVLESNLPEKIKNELST